jgi:hypothetical protein
MRAVRRIRNDGPVRGIAVILGAAVIAGCGGGGDGSLTTNLSSAPGEAAMAGYVQATHHVSMTATASGSNFTLQMDQVPGNGTTLFNGFNANSLVTTVTLTQDGIQAAHSVDTSYFTLNPLVPLGKVNSTGSPYAVVNTSTALPTTLHVGDSGSFETLTYYHDSSQLIVDAYETDTYTISARDAATLLFCMKSVISGTTPQGDTDGLADGTEDDCYAINAAGTATLISVTVSLAGGTLTFR